MVRLNLQLCLRNHCQFQSLLSRSPNPISIPGLPGLQLCLRNHCQFQGLLGRSLAGLSASRCLDNVLLYPFPLAYLSQYRAPLEDES